MELNLVKTTYAELDSTARFVLVLREEPFFFVRMQDTLYMNKNMRGIRKLTAAVETMWKYDFLENEEIMDEVDGAYNTIVEIAGKVAAGQALKAWDDMAGESRIARAKVEALEWIETVYEKLDEADLEEMYAAGYSSYFVEDGLWRAFSQLNKDHPDSQRYQNWSTAATKAAFVYGFKMGTQHRAETL